MSEFSLSLLYFSFLVLYLLCSSSILLLIFWQTELNPDIPELTELIDIDITYVDPWSDEVWPSEGDGGIEGDAIQR